MMMGGMSGSAGGSMANSGSMGMDPMMNMGGQMGNMPPAGYGGWASAPGYGYPGYANGMNGMANGAHGATSTHGAVTGANGAVNGVLGFDLVSLLSGLLNFAINIFVILLVVGLIVGAVVFLKRYLFDGNSELAGIFTPKVKAACTKCGSILQTEWKCCPNCGEAKVTVQPQVSKPQTV